MERATLGAQPTKTTREVKRERKEKEREREKRKEKADKVLITLVMLLAGKSVLS